MTEKIYTFYASILEGSFEDIREKLNSIEINALNSFANMTKQYKNIRIEPDRNDNAGRFYVVGDIIE